jgi:hypothetical protein
MDEVSVIARPVERSISGLMQTAVEQGMPPESLEKLFALFERDQAIQAQKAFANAMAEFQYAAPVVQKNRLVDTGKYSYKYAELDAIADAIRELMHDFGLSYRFDSAVTEKTVTVKCIVSHRMGHQEETQFACPLGGMAGINGAQQTASALSYARRYALLLALGLSTGDRDDDGGGGVITRVQVMEVEGLLAESKVDRSKFLAWLGVESVDDIPAALLGKALKQLKDRVKKGVSNA